MPTSIVLIDAEIDSEDEVMKDLKNVEGVKEAFLVYGVYDIVAKITADSQSKLEEIVTSRVRQLDKVLSTNTLLMADDSRDAGRTA